MGEFEPIPLWAQKQPLIAPEAGHCPLPPMTVPSAKR